MNTIKINGVSVNSGRNIVIRDGKVTIDGKGVTPDGKEIKIEVTGDVASLKCDVGDVTIGGSAGSVNTMSGDVNVAGDVTGYISTMSGDVHCGKVGGSVQSMSGDVRVL